MTQGFFDMGFSTLSRAAGRCRYLPKGSPVDFGSDIKSPSPTEVSLAGEWAFCLFEGEKAVSEKYFEEDFDCSRLEKTELPRLFEKRRQTPFCFPDLPSAEPCALFLKDVELDFSGRKTYLAFEGFLGEMRVFINGSPAAVCDGTGHLTEFEVTRFLKPGKNRVAILLCSSSKTGFFLERGAQSFGIFAPFYFLSRSKGHICDLTLSAEPDDGFFEGSLSVRAFGEFIDGGKCTLYDTKGERVSAADFSEEGTAELKVARPRIWSDEQPELYILEAEICGEYIYKYVGFKRLDSDMTEGLRLNGRRFRFCGGVYDPFGKTAEQIKADIVTLKQNHVNSIILKGNGDCDRVLSLCDKYGILVIADVGVSADAFKAAGDFRIFSDGTLFPLVEGIITERVTALRSHTCLAGFAFLSFCGEGKNLFDAISLVKSLCPLPVFYAGDPADTVRTSGYDSRPDIFVCPPDLSVFDDPFAGKKPAVAAGGLVKSDDIRLFGCFVENPFDCLFDIKNFLPFFKVEEIDASSGDFYITNLFSFSFLSHLECSFEVTSRGKVTAEGFVGALPLSPGRCEKIHLDFDLPEGDENFIRFEFKRLGDCKWAKDGFSEGSVQFALPSRPRKTPPETDGDGLSVKNEDGKFFIKGKRFNYVFSEVFGRFESMEFDRKKLTDGAAELKFECEKALFPAFCGCDFSMDGKTAVLCCKYVYMAEKSAKKETLTAVWCVFPDGRVTLDCSIPAGDFEISRFGLEIPLKNTDFTYFGMGKRSGYNGIFKTEGSAERSVRSCLFDKNDRGLCAFCADRMTVQTSEKNAFFRCGDGHGELSLTLCPDREHRLIFE